MSLIGTTQSDKRAKLTINVYNSRVIENKKKNKKINIPSIKSDFFL